jgi:hypothetical protein
MKHDLGRAEGSELAQRPIEKEVSKLSKFETRFITSSLWDKLEDAHVAQFSHYRGGEHLRFW